MSGGVEHMRRGTQMGTLSRTLLVACVLVAGPVTGAAAAEFRFPPEPVLPVPAANPIPDYSAWYLRGDIGFAINEDPDMSRSGTTFSGTGTGGSATFTRTRMPPPQWDGKNTPQ